MPASTVVQQLNKNDLLYVQFHRLIIPGKQEVKGWQPPLQQDQQDPWTQLFLLPFSGKFQEGAQQCFYRFNRFPFNILYLLIMPQGKQGRVGAVRLEEAHDSMDFIGTKNFFDLPHQLSRSICLILFQVVTTETT